ncbi:centriole, cilia and spindle-associated protein [Engraulis encrasicolus]|uniref:centriole, cilia and spindle-associated protein n=1 Tax=Engraulis encrasicolus TaxID=184585 RepID=UPI002FD4F2FF
MVTKRIRSEYMKKFKDPKWDSYSRCYEELLKYRLTRRLLEQSHNPWFWGEWSSETSGKSTPQGCKVEPLKSEDEKTPAQQTTPSEHSSEPVDAISQEIQVLCESPNRGEEEEDGRAPSIVSNEVKPEVPVKPKAGQRVSRKPSQAKRKPSKRQDPHDNKDAKENRHPFAMYGAGDREADMALKKTHNVCPVASTKEIHESALRAKTRRDVEKQVKRTERTRARSIDKMTKAKSKAAADFDPWVTEYMLRFSARSQ